MTLANVEKFKKISKMLDQAAKDNVNAERAMWVILDVQETLTQIAKDLHFRPEVNS